MFFIFSTVDEGLTSDRTYGLSTISSRSRVIQGDLYGDVTQGDVYIKQDGVLEGDRRRDWERRQEGKKRQKAREEEERQLKCPS